MVLRSASAGAQSASRRRSNSGPADAGDQVEPDRADAELVELAEFRFAGVVVDLDHAAAVPGTKFPALSPFMPVEPRCL